MTISKQALVIALIVAVVLILVLWVTRGDRGRELIARYTPTLKCDVDKVQHRAWKSCYKLAMQHMRYERAAARARAEGRLLVVIGNPSGGWVNQSATVYGCGDVCVDLKGCRPCPPQTRVLERDALPALRTIPTNSAVVFESEVLEYVDDLPAVLAELDRITGNDPTRIYAVHTIGLGEAAWRYHQGGEPPAPPTASYLAERKKDRWGYHNSLGEGLAKRVIYRFPPQDRFTWADL